MRILVALPAISYEMFATSPAAERFPTIGEFSPTVRTLDVFPQELKDIKVDGLWTVNVPHWPLQNTGTKGVAGPGRPQDELFCPAYLRKMLAPLCGKYDKWRPYPARKPLSAYNISMAKRFAKKRCKMFEKIVSEGSWKSLFYVEHSPASIAHLSKKRALAVAEKVMGSVSRASSANPRCDVVVFSPYGVGNKPGFVVSNRIEARNLSNWNDMREYLIGTEMQAGHPG